MWSPVHGTRHRTSASQKSSHGEEKGKSLALLVDVIGGNGSFLGYMVSQRQLVSLRSTVCLCSPHTVSLDYFVPPLLVSFSDTQDT